MLGIKGQVAAIDERRTFAGIFSITISIEKGSRDEKICIYGGNSFCWFCTDCFGAANPKWGAYNNNQIFVLGENWK